MERHQVESSSIRSVGYDAEMQCLEIEFVSGAVYQYFAIPLTTFEALLRAKSKGRYINKHVTSKFTGRRVSRDID